MDRKGQCEGISHRENVLTFSTLVSYQGLVITYTIEKNEDVGIRDEANIFSLEGAER